MSGKFGGGVAYYLAESVRTRNGNDCYSKSTSLRGLLGSQSWTRVCLGGLAGFRKAHFLVFGLTLEVLGV